MPPRKSREVKSMAPSPSPGPSSTAANGRKATGSRSTRSRSSKAPSEDSIPEPSSASSSSAQDVGATEDGDNAEAEEQEEEDESTPSAGASVSASAEEVNEEQDDGDEGDEVAQAVTATAKLSMAERMAKLKDLRMRMNQSSAANRKDLIADHQKSKVTAKELQRLEKQKKLAQTLRLKADAEENGEDLERKKNWEYSIEDNERWEKKLEQDKVKQDTHFHNAEDDAHKRYNRNIRSTKPDLMAYERQKEAALGLAPGTLVPPAGSSSQTVAPSGSKGKVVAGLSASEDLYRGADTLAYGDHKPSEDALDRVAEKINKDIGKYKKRQKDDDDGEVNYINDRNKVFNKKVARYFDKYTKEIRANFERGTAL
ncbi:pre-mRNA-splicing factor SYF2 [Kwoniella heveanensis BCC8398]|uniref:Pre-mRNA-splicing factor SYF2 n=1 Tax=Kwoniella heveanensis BCC8398 TaxID=1296120 RepID=A0A1B9GYZ0_9TREE|nr:pre-mRNA-splicing factor SYF2 [Kwoniella heveanensis BCC8398]